jgi:hypothetical protein
VLPGVCGVLSYATACLHQIPVQFSFSLLFAPVSWANSCPCIWVVKLSQPPKVKVQALFSEIYILKKTGFYHVINISNKLFYKQITYINYYYCYCSHNKLTIILYNMELSVMWSDCFWCLYETELKRQLCKFITDVTWLIFVDEVHCERWSCLFIVTLCIWCTWKIFQIMCVVLIVMLLVL